MPFTKSRCCWNVFDPAALCLERFLHFPQLATQASDCLHQEDRNQGCGQGKEAGAREDGSWPLSHAKVGKSIKKGPPFHLRSVKMSHDSL